jgi:hypothetical protein
MMAPAVDRVRPSNPHCEAVNKLSDSSDLLSGTALAAGFVRV